MTMTNREVAATKGHIVLLGPNKKQTWVNRGYPWRTYTPPKKLPDNPQGFVMTGKAKEGILISYKGLSWSMVVHKIGKSFVHFMLMPRSNKKYEHTIKIPREASNGYTVTEKSHPAFFRELVNNWEVCKELYFSDVEKQYRDW